MITTLSCSRCPRVQEILLEGPRPIRDLETAVACARWRIVTVQHPDGRVTVEDLCPDCALLAGEIERSSLRLSSFCPDADPRASDPPIAPASDCAPPVDSKGHASENNHPAPAGNLNDRMGAARTTRQKHHFSLQPAASQASALKSLHGSPPNPQQGEVPYGGARIPSDPGVGAQHNSGPERPGPERR